jgi:hypothetical protein
MHGRLKRELSALETLRDLLNKNQSSMLAEPAAICDSAIERARKQASVIESNQDTRATAEICIRYESQAD